MAHNYALRRQQWAVGQGTQHGPAPVTMDVAVWRPQHGELLCRPAPVCRPGVPAGVKRRRPACRASLDPAAVPAGLLPPLPAAKVADRVKYKQMLSRMLSLVVAQEVSAEDVRAGLCIWRALL